MRVWVSGHGQWDGSVWNGRVGSLVPAPDSVCARVPGVWVLLDGDTGPLMFAANAVEAVPLDLVWEVDQVVVG